MNREGERLALFDTKEGKSIVPVKFTLQPHLAEGLIETLIPILPFQQRIGMRDESGNLIGFNGRHTQRDVVFDLLGDANLSRGAKDAHIVSYRGLELTDLKNQFLSFAKDGGLTDNEIKKKGVPISKFIHAFNDQATFVFQGKFKIDEELFTGEKSGKKSRHHEKGKDEGQKDAGNALIPLEYNVARAIKWAEEKFRRKSS